LSLDLWHQRLGHTSVSTLQLMQRANAVSAMPECKGDVPITYTGGVVGKHARLPFPHSTTRTRATLELVHADVCGPMPVPS
ncbi:hypothetical protein CXG81DRAFT_15871, partial [Caulochytrium protostelioides]